MSGSDAGRDAGRSSARSAIDEHIIAHYRVVSRALDRLMLPILVERGVTMPQFKALLAVTGCEDGIGVTRLARELSIPQSSASLLVDQLMERSYARRETDPADKRRVFVKATRTGEELVRALRLGRRTTFVRWLEKVGDEDARALAKGLAALARVAAEREDPPASGRGAPR